IDHCEMSSSIQIGVREQPPLKKSDSQHLCIFAAYLVDDNGSGIPLAASFDVHRKAPIAKRVHARVQSGRRDTRDCLDALQQLAKEHNPSRWIRITLVRQWNPQNQ